MKSEPNDSTRTCWNPYFHYKCHVTQYILLVSIWLWFKPPSGSFVQFFLCYTFSYGNIFFLFSRILYKIQVNFKIKREHGRLPVLTAAHKLYRIKPLDCEQSCRPVYYQQNLNACDIFICMRESIPCRDGEQDVSKKKMRHHYHQDI